MNLKYTFYIENYYLYIKSVMTRFYLQIRIIKSPTAYYLEEECKIMRCGGVPAAAGSLNIRQEGFFVWRIFRFTGISRQGLAVKYT